MPHKKTLKFRKVLTPTHLENEAKVETQPFAKANKQKWFINEDGTIINLAANRALDVFFDVLIPGQKLIIYDIHRRKNQLWEIRWLPKSSETPQTTLSPKQTTPESTSKKSTSKSFSSTSTVKPLLKNECIKKIYS